MATRRATIYINGQEIKNNIKSITTEKRKLVRELNHMIVGSKEYRLQLKKIENLNPIITKHRNTLRGVDGAWKKMGKSIGTFAGVAGVALGVQEIVRYGAEVFKLGTQMQVLEKKAKTVFGEALPQVTREAEMNATAMGLTTAQYIDAAAAMADLLIPMKFTRTEAADISTTLVNLSGALSEWTGGQRSAEEVSKVLSKALLGEREQLKELGISILEADIKTRLAEKGLKGLTGEMLQQAKAAATLELITEKTADAQAAYAENSETLVRRTAELNAKFKQIKETIATVLIPVFSRLLDTVNSTFSLFGDSVNEATKAFKNQQAVVNQLESDFIPLIDRHNELKKKTALSTKEQEELKKIIVKIAGTVPSAITQFDEYGTALEISADKAREFVETQKAILEIQNKDAISENEKSLSKLQEKYEVLNNTLKGTKGGFRDIRKQEGEFFKATIEGGKITRIKLTKLSDEYVKKMFSDLGKLKNEIKGTAGLIKQLKGESIVDSGKKKPIVKTGKTPEEVAEEERLKAEAKKRREKAQKEAERQKKATAKRLERIKELIDKHQNDLRIGELDEDQQKLERIKLKYDKEIEAAKGFKDQIKELERLKNLELEAQQDAFDLEKIAKNEEASDAEIEEERLFREKRKAFELAQQLELDAETLSARELAIQSLQSHYQLLLLEADKYGLDTATIEETRRLKLAKINADFDKSDVAKVAQSQAQKLQILQGTFKATGDLFTSFFDLVSSKEGEFSEIQKISTLAQIAFDTASAISSLTSASEANPANAITFGGAGAIQFVSGLARILANIAQAKKLLTKAPTVPQKKEGRWLNAVGADDNTSYRVRYIGQQPSGMLPDHPVLMNTTSGNVIASEAGSEYFVSNRDLSNPQVLNYVRAIDNIVKYRQFAEGGSTGGPIQQERTVATPTQNDSSESNEALIIVINELNETLKGGIFSLIDDDSVIDIFKKFNALNKASGGQLQ